MLRSVLFLLLASIATPAPAAAAALVLEPPAIENVVQVKLSWTAAPPEATGLSLQRRELGSPFRNVVQLAPDAVAWTDAPPGRSLTHEYRLTIQSPRRRGQKVSNVVRVSRPGPPPPLPQLPVVAAEDLDRDGDLDQIDLELALAACGAGCNLLVLPVAYEDVTLEIGKFPDGFALYGFGTRTSVLRAPRSGPRVFHPTVHVGDGAPDGFVIQDLGLDGGKGETQPLLDANGHLHVSVGDLAVGILSKSNGVVRRDGVIRRLEVYDYAAAGISVIDADNWMVESNRVRDIGCHQWDTPCGDPRDFSDGWGRLPDVRGVPGLKRVGYGIIVQANVRDTIVRNNLVERATKIGIEHQGGPCGGPFETSGVTIEGNLVMGSAQGIVLNGGCEARIANNIAYRNRMTGSQASPLGSGFYCGVEGDRTEWLANHAVENAGSAFSLACFTADDVVIRDNTGWGNCRELRGANLYVNGPTSGARPQRLLIENFRAFASPGCTFGILLRGRDGVTIRDVEIEGGFQYGIELQHSNDVVVENSMFRSTDPPAGDDRGVFFHFEGQGSLEDIFVRSSAHFEGYSEEVLFGPSNGPDDGDSVALCALETNPPPGCSN